MYLCPYNQSGKRKTGNGKLISISFKLFDLTH